MSSIADDINIEHVLEALSYSGSLGGWYMSRMDSALSLNHQGLHGPQAALYQEQLDLYGKVSILQHLSSRVLVDLSSYG